MEKLRERGSTPTRFILPFWKNQDPNSNEKGSGMKSKINRTSCRSMKPRLLTVKKTQKQDNHQQQVHKRKTEKKGKSQGYQKKKPVEKKLVKIRVPSNGGVSTL